MQPKENFSDTLNHIGNTETLQLVHQQLYLVRLLVRCHYLWRKVPKVGITTGGNDLYAIILFPRLLLSPGIDRIGNNYTSQRILFSAGSVGCTFFFSWKKNPTKYI